MKIQDYCVKLFDGTCVNHFKAMSKETQTKTILKVAGVAAAVGLISLVAFSLISIWTVPFVVPALAVTAGLCTFAYLTAEAPSVIKAELETTKEKIKRNFNKAVDAVADNLRSSRT